ncbi:hypothetical protein [Nocardia sp. NBC_01327]|uniref:hypothetical protein n=1 Tax=Nocardia sp. NBC_01327 TaxID=2903593 RepID=UPI002E0EC8DD|nr:hypothetical protein OG326_08670 [Nocardia sp. NBC_01327]
MLHRCDVPNGFGNTGIEPENAGLYIDRDGDIWEKRDDGWRLLLQGGVAVDPLSLWDWTEGHVRDYAPFAPVAGVN